MPEAFSLRLDNEQVPFSNLLEIVQWHLQRHPDRAVFQFLKDGEIECHPISYFDLDQKAKEIAVQLLSEAQCGDRALIVLQNGIDFITGFFGCLYAGICAVPVYPPQNRQAYLERLEMIATDCQAQFILGTSEYFDNAETRLQAFDTLSKTKKIAVDQRSSENYDYIAPDINLDSLAFLQYTSGSTSAPKGVMVTHGNLINNIASMQACFGHDEKTIIASWLPMFHDMGLIGAVLQPICIGGKAIAMTPAAFLQKPMRWLEAISHYRATSSYAPNFAYDLCISKATEEDIQRLDLSSWTMALNGAEPIKPETIRDFSKKFAACGLHANTIYPGYGLAEATLFVSGAERLSDHLFLNVAVSNYQHRDLVKPASKSDAMRELISSGIPSPYNDVVIVDPEEHGRIKDGQVGEVWVRGENVASGYWQNPEKTIETFQAKIQGEDAHYMRTGDLGFIYQRHLFICGRIKELIIIRGANFYPQNIEQTLQNNIAGLKPNGGAAFTVEHEGEDALVVVQEVERTWLKKIDQEAVAQQARQAIASEYGLSLHAFILIRPMTLPKTSSGKIQRSRAKQYFDSGELKVVSETIFSTLLQNTDSQNASLENQPLAIGTEFGDVLLGLSLLVAQKANIPLSQLDIEQSIINTGLDSIALNNLVATVKHIFCVTLSLGELLQSSSLLDIATNIVELRKAEQLTSLPNVDTHVQLGDSEAHAFDLSVNQMQMWLLYQKARYSSAYNVPMCLKGRFDIPKLAQALQSLLLTNPILRSQVSFEPRMEKWQQSILPMPKMALVEHNDELIPLDQIHNRVINAAKQPFDLEHEPCYRFEIFHLADGSHYLLLTFHHMVVDLTSMQRLTNTLLTKLRGQNAEQFDTSTSYQDFIHWQQELECSELGREGADYWHNKLAKERPALQWPMRNSLPDTTPGQGTSFEFSCGLTASELHIVCKQLGCTQNSFIFSAYQLFLAKLCNERQFAVGILNTGRIAPKFINSTGYFVEPQIFSADVELRTSFSDLVTQTQEQLFTMIKHAGTSLQSMLEQESRHEKTLQTLFTFYPYQQGAIAPFNADMAPRAVAGGEDYQHIPLPSLGAQFDLSLIAADDGEQLHFRFEYQTDLFTSQHIAQFAQFFSHVMRSVVTQPQLSSDEIALQPADAHDHEFLHASFNRIDYPNKGYVHDLIEHQAQLQPNAIACRFSNDTLSYGELNRKANGLAQTLIAKTCFQSAIGIYAERSLELVVAILACLKAGCSYVPIDPTSPDERVETIVNSAGIKLILSNQAQLPHEIEPISLRLPSVDMMEEVASDALALRPLGDHDLAYIIFTSGSTGTPKGVMNNHGAIRNRVLWMQREYQVNSHDVVLQKTPYTFDVSVWEFLLPLISGATLVLAKPEGHKDSDYLSHLIASEAVTLLHFVPSMLEVFLGNENTQLHSVRDLFCSGEALSIDLQNRFFARFPDCRLHNLYGPTEAAIDVTYWQCQPQSQGTSVPIGRAIDNIQLYVLDAELQMVPAGCLGELYIAGAGLANGYVNQPQQTTDVFIDNPFSIQKATKMYRTGDLVRYDKEGVIEYVGRTDSQVKIRGFRIELGDIDANLLAISEVVEAVTVVVGKGADKQLASYVVLAKPLDCEDIKAQLSAVLPHYMIPTYLSVLDAMPINTNGKLDRKALPAPKLTLNEADYVAPESENEQRLASIWAKVLDLDVQEISRTHHFFELGGHSLAAAKVASLAKIRMRDVFDTPRLADLAQCLSQQTANAQALISAAARDTERFALSPAQSRLWFLNQFQALGGAYNIPTVLQLQGQLHVDALISSIHRVISRHEILRTCYGSEDNVPYQYVVKNATPVIDLHDWSNMSDAQCDDARTQFTADHAEAEFDLASDLPIRVALIKEQAQTYTLCICLHHIAADGVSLTLLLEQISAHYTEQNIDSETPQLQYIDYCQWHAERLENSELKCQQLDFWKKQLQGLKPLLPLPTDRPRPASQTTDGECIGLCLNNEVVTQLKRIASEHNASLYMVLLSAYKLLLSIYSTEQDIAVGTPVLGRSHPQLDDVFGFFANTVVLRNTINTEATFSQLITQVKQSTLAAFEHQDLPFDTLIDALKVPRSSSYSPLFQVMFSLENQQDLTGLFGTNLDVARVPRLHNVAKFDLSMMLEQHDGGVNGYLEFNTSLFDTQTILQFARHFEALLNAICSCEIAGTPLKKLSYMDQTELNTLASMSEGPEGIFSSITEQFDTQVARFGDKVAVSCGEQSLTYQQLAQRANDVAHTLLTENIQGAVGVSIKPSCESIVALLGVLKAGAHYVPLDSQLPAQRLAHIINESEMTHVLVDDCTECAFVEINTLNIKHIDEHELVQLDYLCTADDLAYLMFTSGSTGTPKGITVRHGSITRLVQQANYVTLNEQTVMLQAASLSFDAATFEIWGTLLNGGHLVVHNEDVVSTQSLTALASVNTAWLTASLFHQLVDENPHCLNTLTQLIVGGDVVSAEHVTKAYTYNPKLQIINGYGPTESTTFAATHAIKANSVACARGSIAIGKPINGTQLYVLDEHQYPVPFNVVGELYIGGLGLATGYLNQPQLNQTQFVTHAPFGGQPQRLYRSGDLVRRLPNGDIEFVGRADEQVKLRGFRIELAEIDAVLASLDYVDNCVTVLAGEVLVSYVVNKHGNTELLRAQLQQTLPNYMVPTFIIALDSLPLTNNGKLDRRALPDYKSFVQDACEDIPVTEQESALAALWSQLLLLNKETIGRSSDFFALGGHSLLAAKLVAQCSKAFNMQLSVRDVFDNPTLSEMAAKLKPISEITPLVKVSREQYHDLSYAQSRLWFLSTIDNAAGAYNVPLTIKLNADTHAVDVSRLRQSICKLVARHEVLRTSYLTEQGIPKQLVLTQEQALQKLEITQYQEQELGESLERFIGHFNSTLFNLESELPIRATIICASDETVYLALCIHHIATDGNSMALIGQELAELYHQDKTSLNYQYLDYSQWQKLTLKQGKAQQQLSYWETQLANLPPRLELPTDYARPVEQSYQGACFEVSLPQKVSASLQRVAHSHGCSMYMVMLAAYQLLLAKYSGEQNIAVGSPIANRPLAEFESMVGFFANTLVLCNDLHAVQSVPQLLESVRATTLSAYANQDLPFEYLVEKLQPQRSLSYSPLFQVMFSLQHNDQSTLPFAGLNALTKQFAHQVSKFDLSFMLSQNDDVISGYIEYSTDLYRSSTIARMWRHYVCILEQLESACESQQLVGSITLDYQHELESQYTELNGTVSNEASSAPMFAQLFELQCEKTPDEIALSNGDEQLSYADLALQINVVANRIISAGVSGNQPVGVYLPRSIDLIVTLLAIQQVGAFYVPLDPNYPAQRVADILGDAQPTLIVTERNLSTQLAYVDTDILLIDDTVYEADFSGHTTQLSRTDTAYAIYTSGSTGKPKGIAISHHNVAALIDWAIHQYSKQQLSNVLAATSICFDLSVFEMFVPLCVGGCVHIVEDALTLANGEDYSDLSLINTVPSAMTALLSLGKLPKSVTTINLAGEPLSRELVDALYGYDHIDKIYNLYGPSEDTTYSTYSLVPRGDNVKPTIGRPITGTQAYVMDTEHNYVPIGVTGELYLAGDGVTQGYLNNPAQTQSAYLNIDGQRMYKTGDKVRLLDNYELEYLGRIDHQVKLRGFRIELSEIEHVIHAIDEVSQCVVVVNHHQAQQPQLLAFVTVKNATLESDQISTKVAAHIATTLPDYMQPAHIVVLTELPRLPNGKIARGQLEQQHFDISSDIDGQRPETELGQQLATLWTALVGTTDIFQQDHFFKLGGHSLLAAQLVSRIEEQFAVQLTIKDVFQHPTLQAQIDLIALLRAAMDVQSQTCSDEVEQQEGSI